MFKSKYILFTILFGLAGILIYGILLIGIPSGLINGRIFGNDVTTLIIITGLRGGLSVLMTLIGVGLYLICPKHINKYKYCVIGIFFLPIIIEIVFWAHIFIYANAVSRMETSEATVKQIQIQLLQG